MRDQREQLHRSIWAIAEDLRGSVDGWDFKNYVLGTMFYRFLSEELSRAADAMLSDVCYQDLTAAEAERLREPLIRETGCFLLPQELFSRVQAQKSDHLGALLEGIFHRIEHSAAGTASESSFQGLFDDFDVRSNKLGTTQARRSEKLQRLLDGIADMKLGSMADHEIDAFGDAYEFLMTMYAGNAGKSGGEFFTPVEVSELLTRLGTLGRTEINRVYDPACGSGSLLLQAGKALGPESVRGGFYGQEINVTTYNLCRINLLLHGVRYDRLHIACEDTLLHPRFREDGPFDLIVSNPPYTVRWPGEDRPELLQDARFAPAGVLAPRSKADLAFVLHSLSLLSDTGTAAIVCFPGVLYRGGAEQKIRQYLVEGNVIDSVIQLPAGLFFGTMVSTCILLLRKQRTDPRILLIDASREFERTGSRSRLTQPYRDKILDVCAHRREISGFSVLAAPEQVRQQKFSLTVSAYVEQTPETEQTDPAALREELARIVVRENELRARADRILDQVLKQP